MVGFHRVYKLKNSFAQHRFARDPGSPLSRLIVGSMSIDFLLKDSGVGMKSFLAQIERTPARADGYIQTPCASAA
jgi:hypothetical protein